MSEKRIIFTRPDGGVSIIIPAPGIDLARAMQDVPADAADVQVVDAAEVPNDRTFRAAWKQDQKSLAVDVVKAKDIAHEKRRAKRAAEFAPLDVEATVPVLAAAAEAKRQKIREKYDTVQSEINGTDSVDTLLAIVQSL